MSTLRNQGHRVSFGDVLANWAVANLLSDNTNPDTDPYRYRYQYNSGTWFPSTVGGVTFLLGSINLYQYRYLAGGVEQEGRSCTRSTGSTGAPSRRTPTCTPRWAATPVPCACASTRSADNRIAVVVKE